MLRTGLSFLKRIPGVPSLNGIYKVESCRLLPLRRPEVSFLIQSVNFCENVKVFRRTSRFDTLTDKYRDGVLKLPSPVEVTSLPPRPFLNGDEDYIAVNLISLNNSGVNQFPFVLTASSKKGQFKKICKPQTSTEVNEGVVKITGLRYDNQNDVVLDRGEPTETVQVSESLDGLINFVKEHEKPVLLLFGNKIKRNLYLCFEHYDKYKEFTKACPLSINVHVVLKKVLGQQCSLQQACSSLLNVDIPSECSLSRTRGLLNLYTEHLQKHTGKSFLDCTSGHADILTYMELMAIDIVNPVVYSKLSQAGLRLDHLHYLKTQGNQKFNAYLAERGIYDEDIDKLYTYLTK